jgi:hypothetical protein|tara:strand:+ start:781 stop:1044 length:264 start_codon:yes stop_codon:yes gene_type:complete
MEKNKETKRTEFSKEDMITVLRIHHKMHNDLIILQEAFMQVQQDLFHERWKYRHVSRALKQVAKSLGQPDLAISEEELDAQLRRKEN